MPKTPGDMMRAIANNLPARTGRTLEEWIEMVNKAPASTTKERMAWLKQTHGLGGATVMTIVSHAEGCADIYETPGKLVDAQYAGDRAHLRPLYERLIKTARTLGRDLRIAPCQTYVPLMRKYQFAVIKPTTKTRIDLGLALPKTKAGGPLRAAKNLGGGDRITHRIEITSAKDIDDQVRRWLKAAYVLSV